MFDSQSVLRTSFGRLSTRSGWSRGFVSRLGWQGEPVVKSQVSKEDTDNFLLDLSNLTAVRDASCTKMSGASRSARASCGIGKRKGPASHGR